MATPIATGWAGAVLQTVSLALGQGQRAEKAHKRKKKREIVAKALGGQRYLCPA